MARRKRYGEGTVYKRGRRWWISYWVDGVQKTESSRSFNKEAAEDLLNRRLAEMRAFGKSPSRISVNDLLDLVVYDYKTNHKDVDWATTLIDVHLRPAFKNLDVEALGSDHIKAYVGKRLAAGRKNATINHELALLRRAYTLGQNCDPPKVRKIPKIVKLAENNTRTGFFTEEEYQAMLSALPDYLRPILVFAFNTGCRRGEILNLQWDQVDWKAGIIRLEPGTTKNKEARMIPLTTELQDLLRKLKEQRDEHWPKSPWVFSRIGFKILNFRNAWGRACEKTGVTRLFHDLRRSGVRNLVRSGVSEKVAMKISGHKTRSVFERYNITNEDDLRDAARKLEAFRKAAKA